MRPAEATDQNNSGQRETIFPRSTESVSDNIWIAREDWPEYPIADCGYINARELSKICGRGLVPFVHNWDAWGDDGRGGRRVELRYAGRYSGPLSPKFCSTSEEALRIANAWSVSLGVPVVGNPRPSWSGAGVNAAELVAEARI